MVLKYKTNNESWVYRTINDLIISDLDINDIVTANTDGTKEIDLVNHDGKNKILYDILTRVNEALEYRYNFNLLTDKLRYSRKYLLVSYTNDSNERDCIILSKEAYLMSDEGKTIERLI